MPVANRIIRSAIYIESLFTSIPVVESKPAMIRPLEKPTTGSQSRPSKPTKHRSRTSKKPAKHFIPNLGMAELPPFNEPPYKPALIPPTLTFSFEQAKSQLIEADTRFEQLFTNLRCEPFEQLEPVDPFRALVTAVISHRRSWIKARFLQHQFLRLFDSSLPVELSPTYKREYAFPSPGRVASLDSKILGTVGMNKIQAERVLDIAKRFADNQISAEKLVNASDKEAKEMLTAAQGVGEGTADVFAITALRRPDILPAHSPRAQQGLLKWVLSSHEPGNYPLYISRRKLFKLNKDELKKPEVKAAELIENISVLPTPAETSIPTSTVKARKSKSKQSNGVLLVPTSPVQLPEGMTLDVLKARTDGGKVVGRRCLLPSEMEALTASWKPYRSLGIFYMWTLVGSGEIRAG